MVQWIDFILKLPALWYDKIPNDNCHFGDPIRTRVIIYTQILRRHSLVGTGSCL